MKNSGYYAHNYPCRRCEAHWNPADAPEGEVGCPGAGSDEEGEGDETLCKKAYHYGAPWDE